MVNMETRINRILFSNESGAIAKELFDLLLCAVKPGFGLDGALRLIYPRMDHPRISRAQYAVKRERVLADGEGESAKT